jgi:RNA recognition motif-containing protein
MEKTKEMLRYKNSKKRCNLYVKNFPPTTTKQQLEELFGKYGEIENIKLFPKEGEAIYAFVCFKNPEKASQAKAELNQTTFNGKQLYINHYEIKEIRKAQYEEFHDKTDFQNFKKQNLGYTVDLFNKPEIYALLNQIFTFIGPRLQSQFRGAQGGNMRRPPHNRQHQGNFPPKPMGQITGGPMGQQMTQQMPPVGMPGGYPPQPMGMRPQQMMPPM